MTLVLCWLDESHGMMRLAAVADSRASRRTDTGDRETVTEATPKLFALPVRCHHLDSLEMGTGAWRRPYYETNVGVGYTGNCFESLAVIAHIQRCFSQLSALEDDPLPEPQGLLDLASALLDRFMAEHTDRAKLTVRLLMFGWSAERRPWMAKLGWEEGARDAPQLVLASSNVIWAIGTDPSATSQAAAARRGGERRLARSPRPADAFEAALAAALTKLASTHAAEDAVLNVMCDPHWASVGGRLEKLELFPDSAAPCTATVALTHDTDGGFWQGLPVVKAGTSLGYHPVSAMYGPR